MNPKELQRWLSEEEAKLHGNCDAALAEGLILDKDELVGIEITVEALDRLAACRVLLKKQEWVLLDPDSKIWKCLECGKLLFDEMLKMYRGNKTDLHFQDCALAAEIEGYPREVPDGRK